MSDRITDGFQKMNIGSGSGSGSGSGKYNFDFGGFDDGESWVDEDFDINSVLGKSAGTALDNDKRQESAEDDWEDTDGEGDDHDLPVRGSKFRGLKSSNGFQNREESQHYNKGRRRVADFRENNHGHRNFSAKDSKRENHSVRNTNTHNNNGDGLAKAMGLSKWVPPQADVPESQPRQTATDRNGSGNRGESRGKKSTEHRQKVVQSDELSRAMGLSQWVPPIKDGADDTVDEKVQEDHSVAQQGSHGRHRGNRKKHSRVKSEGKSDGASRDVVRIHYTEDNDNSRRENTHKEIVIDSVWASASASVDGDAAARNCVAGSTGEGRYKSQRENNRKAKVASKLDWSNGIKTRPDDDCKSESSLETSRSLHSKSQSHPPKSNHEHFSYENSGSTANSNKNPKEIKIDSMWA